ncbi:MAG: 50S ribosomal protein L17 [Pirellulales bacterium]|nr:50S ribosomal protein L17 [Pirellulales bacterium]
MRHRKRGRVLGRSPSHRKALLRNLASALFLTERDKEDYLDAKMAPKVKGRIVTTLPKAKEVRTVVERCITIARNALPAVDAAEKLGPGAERNTEAWRAWRKSKKWQQWAAAMAPAVNARRRVLTLLGNKEATELCFSVVAPRFAERSGGYTRVVRLADPRLGDSGTRAVLEFVGVRDRAAKRAPAPRFETEPAAT